MTILSLCDYSGVWSKPYRDAGYEVIQIDLKFGDDVRLLKPKDLPPILGVLAAPPCTVFAVSGARWWKSKSTSELLEGLSLVDACLRIIMTVRPRFWALENPVGRLKEFIGDYVMTFQPCDFGDPYTKLTCLWGNFNTNLPRNPVEPKEGSKMWSLYGGKSTRTKELRSITPPGFAKAFFEANNHEHWHINPNYYSQQTIPFIRSKTI